MEGIAHGVDRLGRLLAGTGVILLVVVIVVGWPRSRAGAATPAVVMTPGPYRSGETISVSVGPNTLFTPNLRIIIIECAAPNGVLPTDDSSCDGNTAPGDSILVAQDGSFSEPAYPLYQLPNSALAEVPTHLPVCNATAECVLYVGENQNDFTKPKVFSAPFTLGSAGATTTIAVPTTVPAGTGTGTQGSGTSTQGSGTSTQGSGVGSAVPKTGSASEVSGSVGAGSLAFTGAPEDLTWLVAAGLLLMVVGTVGRRLTPRIHP